MPKLHHPYLFLPGFGFTWFGLDNPVNPAGLSGLDWIRPQNPVQSRPFTSLGRGYIS